MNTPILGIEPLGRVDGPVFEQLRSLRPNPERGYSVSRRAFGRLDERYTQINRLIKSVRRENRLGRGGWLVLDSVVPAGQSQILPGWHTDGDNLLAVDKLPTEVLCIELPGDRLSCREPDLRADQAVWNAICKSWDKPETLDRFPHLSVRALEAGVIYGISAQAVHRSPMNPEPAPIDRTIIEMR